MKTEYDRLLKENSGLQKQKAILILVLFMSTILNGYALTSYLIKVLGMVILHSAAEFI